MNLRPRHYVLLAVVVGLLVFRIVSAHQHPPATSYPTPIRNAETTPSVVAAWSAFDKAAALRDAPNDQYVPALQALNAAKETLRTHPASSGDPNYPFADLEDCRIWLMSYHNGTISGPNGRVIAAHHIDTCAETHHASAN